MLEIKKQVFAIGDLMSDEIISIFISHNKETAKREFLGFIVQNLQRNPTYDTESYILKEITNVKFNEEIITDGKTEWEIYLKKDNNKKLYPKEETKI